MLDTCHIWDAGYNIADDLDGVLTQFDKVIGLHRLYAVHLNDSMNPAVRTKTATRSWDRAASGWTHWCVWSIILH